MTGKKEFEDKGEKAGLMARMAKPLWEIGKVVGAESGFCVLDGSISMVEKGFFGVGIN